MYINLKGGRKVRPPFKDNWTKLAVFICCTIIICCTKEVPMELEQHIPLPVVNSIFSPNSPIKLYFSNSGAINQNDPYLASNMTFQFYENNQLVIDSTIDDKEVITPLIPIPGNTYKIHLQSYDAPLLHATDSVPNLVAIQDATIIIPAGIDEYGGEYAEAQITFIDPENHENYYEILIYNYQDNSIDSYWSSMYTECVDPVLINEGNHDYAPTSYFFSDQLFNGQTYTLRIQSPGGLGTDYEYGVALRSVSKSYYLYRKYYTRHAYNQQNQGDFLDILYLGEPQTMYTNVTNGYGIFACYQETHKILREKQK